MAHAKRWDPMAQAFTNANFNKYDQGPGADLDASLQPGAVAAARGNIQHQTYKLCLKYVPKEMTEKAIFNLCSNYGKVTFVSVTPKTPFIFVSFATLKY